jgi:hypothetical protein
MFHTSPAFAFVAQEQRRTHAHEHAANVGSPVYL